MKINSFSVPFYVEKIDINKIQLKNENFKKHWFSQTTTSFPFINKITVETESYLKNLFIKILKEDIKTNFDVALSNIWENRYSDNSFQEKHIHPQSHFSFIIYKKVKKSNTVFFNPGHNLIVSFYGDLKIKMFDEYLESNFHENDMVVFPSYIEHLVKPNSESTTISGNFKIKVND